MTVLTVAIAATRLLPAMTRSARTAPTRAGLGVSAVGLVMLIGYLVWRSRHWPPGVWLMLVLAGMVASMLRYTVLGRHIFAVGSNEQTARLCGVRVHRVKIGVYMLCGALAGMAGVMQFSRLTVGDPTVAAGKELDVIAAVVIGGGSLSGGEGSVLGSMIGALIMTVIRSGCSQVGERGLPNWVQEIVTGAIIVLAVALDRLRQRRST
jgi:ribose/xylose/arabinose/galactoside ABC-type transport system permease subunit